MDWQTNWLIDWKIDWQIDWLTDWLTDRLNDWCIDWLTHSLTHLMIAWLILFVDLKLRSPQQCPAIDYTRHTLDGAASLLNSNKYFPSRYCHFFLSFNYHACTPVEQERGLQSVFAQTKSHFWSSVSLTCSICQADNCKQASQEATLHFSLMACFAVIFAFLFSHHKCTKSSIYWFVVLLIGRYCGLMVQDGTLSSEVWVQVQVLVFVLCSWARYFTLIVPTSI